MGRGGREPKVLRLRGGVGLLGGTWAVWRLVTTCEGLLRAICKAGGTPTGLVTLKHFSL